MELSFLFSMESTYHLLNAKSTTTLVCFIPKYSRILSSTYTDPSLSIVDDVATILVKIFGTLCKFL